MPLYIYLYCEEFRDREYEVQAIFSLIFVFKLGQNMHLGDVRIILYISEVLDIIELKPLCPKNLCFTD